MNQINDKPNQYDFGLDFNYAVWTPNTRLTLVNVPWNNDYRDIVRFENKKAVNDYIDSIENSGIVVENLSYAKPNQPIRLNIPFNAAAKYNYLRASNQLQPITGDQQKDYYYFITNVTYIAPNTTELTVQLDVWQTYGYDVQFGNSYIERGHIGIANQNNFDHYGKDYLTAPEGLDIGNEYRIVNRQFTPIISQPYEATVLVYTSIQLEPSFGTLSDPHIHSAWGSRFEQMQSGAAAYIFTYEAFSNFMNYMSAYPWIAQGIMSVTLIPATTRYYQTANYSGLTINGGDHTIANAGYAPTETPNQKVTKVWKDWRTELLKTIPEKYRILKKFLTFPYTAIELTSYTGNNTVFKPELWNDSDATITETVSLSAPNQRIMIHGGTSYNKEIHDVSTQIANFPQMPIVNNAGMLYMASNAHQISWQRSAADWSQQRAMGSGQTAYDQAAAQTANYENAARIGRNADISQTALNNQIMAQQAIANGVFAVGGGALSGMMQGGAAGGGVGAAAGAAAGVVNGGINAAQGAVNYAIQSGANNQSLTIRNSANVETTASGAQTQNYIRDTNKQLVDWAAKGDYANSIAGINAKVQDAQLTPPSIVGQAGGESFNMVNGYFGYALKFKMPNPNVIKIIGDYWLR